MIRTNDDPRIARFKHCYTSVVHDVMRSEGLVDFTLPPRIMPLQADHILCGPAFTIEGEVDQSLTPHDSLLAWTGLLSKAPYGHIWVSQPNTHEIAQMGELSAETLHKKGVLGCVLDGALRDSNFILKLGFTSWRTHHTPRDIVAFWKPTKINEPIKIDQVIINPGDWLHGDRDGMVVVPYGYLDEIISKCETAMQAENKVRSAILSGMDPQEAYLKYGKF